MKVTIYILTYKHFENLYDAIKSVLNQDYSCIQLIVSDDGSPDFPKDEVVNFIELHKKDNIVDYTVLANKKNVGTVRHINNLLKIATGDIYVPLAGDDLFYSNDVINKIVECYHRTKFKVLTTSRIKYGINGDVLGYMPHCTSRAIIKKKMGTASQQHKMFTESKMYDFASGSAMAYEANFLKEMGFFDERFVLWEDGPFINKMTSKGYALTLGYDIVAIKYRDGGVSSGGNPLLQNDMFLFNETDRWINSDSYGFFHKRVLKCIKRKYLVKNLWQRFLLRICFFDVFLDRMLYINSMKWAERKDREYLNL